MYPRLDSVSGRTVEQTPLESSTSNKIQVSTTAIGQKMTAKPLCPFSAALQELLLQTRSGVDQAPARTLHQILLKE